MWVFLLFGQEYLAGGLWSLAFLSWSKSCNPRNAKKMCQKWATFSVALNARQGLGLKPQDSNRNHHCYFSGTHLGFLWGVLFIHFIIMAVFVICSLFDSSGNKANPAVFSKTYWEKIYIEPNSRMTHFSTCNSLFLGSLCYFWLWRLWWNNTKVYKDEIITKSATFLKHLQMSPVSPTKLRVWIFTDMFWNVLSSSYFSHHANIFSAGQ